MHPQDTPIVFDKNLEVAARLRRLDDTETVFLSRHVEIGQIVACDLQEYTCVGPALVRLSG
jgi:hypothetical protein